MIYAVIAFFVIAYTSDLVTMAWHRRREAQDRVGTSNRSAFLEALTWAPILLAVSVDLRIAWACAAGSCVGCWLGTWRGMR